MSALDRSQARHLVRNLTGSHGFRNQDLITEGCFYEYILSRNDPSGNITQDLQNGILDVGYLIQYLPSFSAEMRRATQHARPNMDAAAKGD